MRVESLVAAIALVATALPSSRADATLAGTSCLRDEDCRLSSAHCDRGVCTLRTQQLVFHDVNAAVSLPVYAPRDMALERRTPTLRFGLPASPYDTIEVGIFRSMPRTRGENIVNGEQLAWLWSSENANNRGAAEYAAGQDVRPCPGCPELDLVPPAGLQDGVYHWAAWAHFDSRVVARSEIRTFVVGREDVTGSRCAGSCDGPAHFHCEPERQFCLITCAGNADCFAGMACDLSDVSEPDRPWGICRNGDGCDCPPGEICDTAYEICTEVGAPPLQGTGGAGGTPGTDPGGGQAGRVAPAPEENCFGCGTAGPRSGALGLLFVLAAAGACRRRWIWTGAVLVVACAAMPTTHCELDDGPPGIGCKADDQCPAGDACVEGFCEGDACDDQVRCLPGFACAHGHCVSEGDPCGELQACDDECVDLASDPRSCGLCAQRCLGVDARCVQGTCCEGASCCEGGLARCAETCTDLASDLANCGSCGLICPAGMACETGTCTGCPAGTEPTPCGGGLACAPDATCMVEIPGGAFELGSAEEPDAPIRTVQLSPFRLDMFEASRIDFETCVASAACAPLETPVGDPTFPADGVSWQQAADFCAFAGKRLPTEAEWERAARGTDGRPFPWGAELPSCDRAISRECGGLAPSGTAARGHSQDRVVDLAGSVAEWVADWYAPDGYLAGSERDPIGPATGTEKVLRGGSYLLPAAAVRATTRARGDLSSVPGRGVRCAVSSDGP